MALAPCSARAVCMARAGFLCASRGGHRGTEKAQPWGQPAGGHTPWGPQARAQRGVAGLTASLPLFRAAAAAARGKASFCTRAASGSPSPAPGPSASADVAPADVDIGELAAKAKLQLTPEEAAEFQSSVARIVGWFGQLQAADVEGVAPAVHATSAVGEPGLESLRSDTPVAFEGREEMLEGVPSRQGPYLKVPRILGGDPDA